MFFIDFFLDSLHKYPYALRVPFYIFLLFIGFLLTVSGIIYIQTGEIVLSPSIIFDGNVLFMLLKSNQKYLYTALLGEHIVLALLFFWMHHKLNNRSNCAIKRIHIEEIATNWLSSQQTKKMIIQEHILENPQVDVFDNFQSVQQTSYNDSSIMEFYQELVLKETLNISKEEMTIITELLTLLDTQGDIPSVVSYCEKDPEKSYKNNAITEDGKTSFDVLRKVTLKDHTLNVAYQASDLIRERARNNYGVLFAPAIISALAHDIGKIRKMKDLSSKISPEIFTEQPHYMISKIYFMRMYPHYVMLKDVVEAIELHHVHKLQSGGTLAYLLVAADKSARQIEINNFFKELSDKENPNIREKQGVSVLNKSDLFNSPSVEAPQQSNNQNTIERRLLTNGIKKDKITRTWGRIKFDNDIKELFKDGESGFVAMLGVDDIVKYEPSKKTELLQKMVNYVFSEIRGIADMFTYDDNVFVLTFDRVNIDAIKAHLEEIRNTIEYKSDEFTVSVCGGLCKDFTSPENILESVRRGLSSAYKDGGNRVTYTVNKKNSTQKKKRRLSSIADVDLMGDYKSGKKTKDASELSEIEEFDLSEFENDILLNLKTNINKSKSVGYQKHSIESISYDDVIVFSFKVVEQAIQKSLGYDKDCAAMTRHFIKTYRESGKIGMVNVKENFFTSKFCIEDKGGVKTEFVGVPFFLKIFDISELNLSKSKKEDSYLKDLTVKKISECK